MSDQPTGTDQETGAGPVDPNTPDTTSETAQPAEQPQQQPKSPDEIDENREGGGEIHEKGSVGGEEDEDEDN